MFHLNWMQAKSFDARKGTCNMKKIHFFAPLSFVCARMINHIGIGIVYFLSNAFEGQKAHQNSECVQIHKKTLTKGSQKATKVLEDPSDISGCE